MARLGPLAAAAGDGVFTGNRRRAGCLALGDDVLHGRRAADEAQKRVVELNRCGRCGLSSCIHDFLMAAYAREP